jgi:Zn-dependent protease
MRGSLSESDQPMDAVLHPGEPASSGAACLREGVAEELDRLEKPKANATQGILILAFTAFLFAGLQVLRDWNWVTVALLLAVLTFHELGHLLAMRAFGYQDTRMFFIPFLGAAVAGRKHDATGSQRAIVLLAGPVPGLVAGFVLAGMLEITGTRSDTLETLSGLLLFINAFNLLPFEPLDGGRFMATVLFSRQPALEAVVRVLGALTIAFIAYQRTSWVLGLLALFMLMSTRLRLWLGRAARLLTSEIPPADLGSPAIPPERRDIVARLVEAEVESHLGSALKPGSFAWMMQGVWLRAQERPPPVGRTVALLGFYAFFVVGSGALVWRVWRADSALGGETALASQHVGGTVPGSWRKVAESLEGEVPWSVQFERADGAGLHVVITGLAPLRPEQLDGVEAEWGKDGVVVSREDVAGGGTLFRVSSEDGLALRVHVLERIGLVWAVTYADAAYLAESELDLRSRVILSALQLR